MDILNNSSELSNLDLKIKTEHLLIDVLWFRTMDKSGKWKINSHSHHSFEFHFCAKGSSAVVLDNKKFIVNEGEFYLTQPGVIHEQENYKKNNYLEYSLNCNITLLDSNISEGRIIYQILKDSKLKIYSSKNIISLFEEALEEAVNKKIGYYNKILNILSLILIECTRVINTDSYNYKVLKKFKDYDIRYNEIYNFILSNISKNLKNSDVSNYINLSIKQVNRIVKSNSDLSLKQLINDIKINKSKDLLIQTNMPINEIVELIGFSSVYYFCQFFKRYEGVSPTKFREMSQNIKK